MLARLIRGEFDLVDEREIVYYRNVYDHLVRYTELIESAREMVSDLMQTHLAAVVEPAEPDHEGADDDLDDRAADDADRRHLRHELRGVGGAGLPHRLGLRPFALGLMTVVGLVAYGLFRWRRWI